METYISSKAQSNRCFWSRAKDTDTAPGKVVFRSTTIASANHNHSFRAPRHSSVVVLEGLQEVYGRDKGGRSTLWKYPLEFCRDTSLHGLKYVAEERSHFVERIFWMAAFALGVFCSAYLIRDVLRKWQESPIFVSFDTTATPIWEIPFPAVTICNINKARKSKAMEILNLNNTEEDAARDRFLLQHVCSAGGSDFIPFKPSPCQKKDGLPIIQEDDEDDNLQNVTGEEIQEFLRDAAQPCSSLLLHCSWQGTITNCSQLFQPVVTDHGQCCTFNMMPLSLMFKNRKENGGRETEMWEEWDPETESEESEETYSNDSRPRHQIYPGKRLGLSVTLHQELEDYYCISGNSTGFLAVFHSPVQYPLVSEYSLALSPGKETFVELRPYLTNAKERIRAFPASQRGCYFTDEKPLLFYTHYSQYNCVAECDANHTLKICECVLYHMPRDNQTPLCGSEDIKCVQKVRGQLEGSYGPSSPRSVCNCLPTCTEHDFTAEMSATPLADLPSTDPVYSNKSNIAVVHFFLGQSHFVAKLRSELYGTSDLLANTGGLLGLCLGFSGLSAIEVIYFFTLRPWCRSRNRMCAGDNGNHHDTNMA